jgi:hypothetical protein
MLIPYTDISHSTWFIYLPILLTVSTGIFGNVLLTTSVFIIINILVLLINKINCSYYAQYNKIYEELDMIVTELESNNIYMIDDIEDIYLSIVVRDITDHIKIAKKQLHRAYQYRNSYILYTMLNVEDMQDTHIIQFRTNFIVCIAKLYEIIDNADKTHSFIQAALNTCEYVKQYSINYDTTNLDEYEGFVNSLIRLYLQYYTLTHDPIPTVSASIVQ